MYPVSNITAAIESRMKRLSGNVVCLEKMIHLRDLDVSRRIILKLGLNKLAIELQIGIKLLKILSRGGIICI
jgi:hypothetical protein